MRYEIAVHVTVSVDDEDAVQAAAFDLANDRPDDEEFARQSTRTIEAALSVLMVHSRDIEKAMQALSARTPGLRFAGLFMSPDDVESSSRPGRPDNVVLEYEPQTVEELSLFLREHFNGCSGWESFGSGGSDSTFRCFCGEMSGAFPMEDAQLQALEAHVGANAAARREYNISWHQRHSPPD